MEEQFTVIEAFKPIRESATGRLDVRLIQVGKKKPEARLDVRQWVEYAQYTGYTQKGVCLTLEEFERLVAQAGAVRAAFTAAPGQAQLV